MRISWDRGRCLAHVNGNDSHRTEAAEKGSDRSATLQRWAQTELARDLGRQHIIACTEPHSRWLPGCRIAYVKYFRQDKTRQHQTLGACLPVDLSACLGRVCGCPLSPGVTQAVYLLHNVSDCTRTGLGQRENDHLTDQRGVGRNEPERGPSWYAMMVP